MLRLELLKVKADLERELEDLIVNARSAASTFLVSGLGVPPATGRTGSPPSRFAWARTPTKTGVRGSSSGCPGMHPLLDLIT